MIKPNKGHLNPAQEIELDITMNSAVFFISLESKK